MLYRAQPLVKGFDIVFRKFKKLFFNDIISSPLDEGWVKTPYISNPPAKNRPVPSPYTHFQHYPSGYIFPYHYKNPVTGK
jgi:hypothetical protein